MFQVKAMKDNGDYSSEHSPSHEAIGYEASGDELPTKRFHHLNKVLEQKFKEGIKKSVNPPGHGEIQRYFDSVETLSEAVDPLSYWENQVQYYPILSSIALDILAVPASSAPFERVFSTAGDSIAGKRNHLADQNLEREILLKKKQALSFNTPSTYLVLPVLVFKCTEDYYSIVNGHRRTPIYM